MYCTKKNKKDFDFDIKLLTQYNSWINQQEFKEVRTSDDADSYYDFGSEYYSEDGYDSEES